MKVLAVVLAIILVAQLAMAVPVDHPLYDLVASEDRGAIENNNQEIATEDIPVASKNCSFTACDNACRRLGYRYGQCISATVCRCYG